MRIGINTLFEDPQKGTGGLTYLRNLIRNLANLDEHNEYVLFVSPRNRDLFSVDRDNFSCVPCPFSKERRLSTLAFEQTMFPVLARRNRIEVFHSPGNIAPLWLPCASVVTIHSLIHYKEYPIEKWSRCYRRLMMPPTVHTADRIIAVSNKLKEELSALLNVPEGKMVTVWEGIDSQTFSPKSENRLESLGQPYVLFVSALWPYKNAHGLIDAFAKVVRAIPRLDLRLVIVGEGWHEYRGRLEGMVSSLGLAERVSFVGAVPHREIGTYYQNAALFVYPSFHELFGLPILEAMASGTPVVASNRGSLPEIAQDAAILIDPSDVDAMTNAMCRVLADKEFSSELIRRGLERARIFSWENTARLTIQVYEAAYQEWKLRRR